MLEEIGVKIITLDLPFRLNHVNCFLAEGKDGYVVIDAGLHREETVKRWEKELGETEISDLFITHYHPDHYGYAGGFQEKYNVRVSMTEIDASMGDVTWKDQTIHNLLEKYQLAGIPRKNSLEMVNNTESFVDLVNPPPKVDHYFQEGEQVVIGKLPYQIYFTPGHADGLINFFNKEKGILFSTDHILPKITPNISYWFHGDPNPLATYLSSLTKIEHLEAEYVIPSHGKPFYDANQRIREIKRHHEERLEVTMDALKEGGTVYDVCRVLFQKQLTVHEIRFAIGETLAHLEYLRDNNDCQREILNGNWWYTRK